AASQRLTLSREIPPHIDRSRSAGEFILERLEHDPDLVAIFEANGGVNVIGRSGLLDLAKFRRPPRGRRPVPGDRRNPRRLGRIRSIQPRRAVGP
ncbi:hypothetical protein QM646_46175, partial [Rhodococcus erythropolis]|nr:hypothetical protein [Rhodococcus erythropolis]